MKETIWILARIFIALFAVFTISNSDAATVRKVETCAGKPEATVLVDLVKQSLFLCDNTGKAVFEVPVLTGAAGMRTPAGVFTITNQATNVKFEGGYKSAYWLGLGQYRNPETGKLTGKTFGLHTADWWTDQELQYRDQLNKAGVGSHGCINVPPKQMAILFKILRPGDKVYIF